MRCGFHRCRSSAARQPVAPLMRPLPFCPDGICSSQGEDAHAGRRAAGSRHEWCVFAAPSSAPSVHSRCAPLRAALLKTGGVEAQCFYVIQDEQIICTQDDGRWMDLRDVMLAQPQVASVRYDNRDYFPEGGEQIAWQAGRGGASGKAAKRARSKGKKKTGKKGKKAAGSKKQKRKQQKKQGGSGHDEL